MGSNLDESRTRVRVKLWGVLVISAVVLFVSLLILLTDDVVGFWPLFAIPIVLGGVLLYTPGAIVATAASALALFLTVPAGSITGGDEVRMAVSIAAFALCGIAAGAQGSRAQRRALALEATSFRDTDTGLYKPTYFRQRLIEEVRRAERHEVDLSLIVVRLDGLEAFRDTFGAYKTGLLMEHLADVLRITVRDTDVVGRYGPESFGVVLPFAGTGEAASVSDRVRLAACAAEFEGDVLQPSTHCPVSVAFASFPVEAASLPQLVALTADRLADTAPDHASPRTPVSMRLSELPS